MAMAELMRRFEAEGSLKPPPSLVAAARDVMTSASISDTEVLSTISDVHARTDGYTLDPHSAIGVVAAQKVRAAEPSDTPMVCLACAHWAKFPDANLQALGPTKAGALKVPEPLASLAELPTRVQPLPYDVAGVQAFIQKTLAERKAA